MNTVYETRPEKLFIGEMTESPCPAHVHAMAEVVVQTRGYSLITIDEVQYRLNPGDAAVVFPVPVGPKKIILGIRSHVKSMPPKTKNHVIARPV